MRDNNISGIEMLLRLYHGAAAGLDGVFVLTAIDPQSGEVTSTSYFEVGAVHEMAAAALSRSEVGQNVYFSPALMRRELAAGQRGTCRDIVAVLGVVLDDDADTGKVVREYPQLAFTAEVRTSNMPTKNRHLHLVFDRPLTPEDGKLVANEIHRRFGGDVGGKDVAHIWRLPDTLNYPNRKKIARGRPQAPQPVTLSCVGPLLDPTPLVQAAAADKLGWHSIGEPEHPKERDNSPEALPGWLQCEVARETNGKDRSSHAHHVFMGLMERGLTDDEIRLIADGAPFARKFWERGDLDAEIARNRTKWQAQAAQRDEPTDSSSQDWRPGAPFLRTARGALKPLLENAMVALRHAPEWNGVLQYDEFRMAVVLQSAPPWHDRSAWAPRLWEDNDDREATAWMHRQDLSVTIKTTVEAVQAVARDATVHPVRAYFCDLQWDSVGRCQHLASRYFGAEDSAYHRAVSRCAMIAAVARVMEPGCQVDSMPLLEGAQGARKSSAVRTLFEPWFSDDLSDLGSKDSKMEMQGIWGLEVAELAAMSRADIERYKAFISRRTDRFRPSYGRSILERPRQAVMWGTTNQDSGYLKDETGGRRFWPIKCGKNINLEALKRDKDQLWAEAVHLYKQGEPWWLVDPVVQKAAQEVQDNRREIDPWEPAIAEHLTVTARNTSAGARPATSVSDVLTMLGIEDSRRSSHDEKRVVRCLRAQGWRYSHRGPRPGRLKMYVPEDVPFSADNAPVGRGGPSR